MALIIALQNFRNDRHMQAPFCSNVVFVAFTIQLTELCGGRYRLFVDVVQSRHRRHTARRCNVMRRQMLVAGWLQRQLMDLFHSLSLRVLHKVFFSTIYYGRSFIDIGLDGGKQTKYKENSAQTCDVHKVFATFFFCGKNSLTCCRYAPIQHHTRLDPYRGGSSQRVIPAPVVSQSNNYGQQQTSSSLPLMVAGHNCCIHYHY